MQKVYSRINWENGEIGDTPLNERNLNRMDSAINEIDNRVVEFDTSKLSVTDSQNLIADWQLDETTGIITITRKNGDTFMFDLNVEKIPVSFSLSDDGILTMMTSDGTIFTANIGAMIPVLTFNSSNTIGVTVSGEGANKTYSFNVLDGSITDTKLESGYLAKVKLNADNAATSEEYAGLYANKSEAWAVGQKNGEGVPPTDETYHNNAKYWAEKAKEQTNIGNGTLTIKQGNTVKGTFSANQSEDKEIVVSDSAEDILTVSGKTVQTELDEINRNLTTSDNLKFRFATDGEGNYGYLGADDSFIPFKSGLKGTVIASAKQSSNSKTTSLTLNQDVTLAIIVASHARDDNTVSSATLSASNGTLNTIFVIDTKHPQAAGIRTVIGVLENAPSGTVVSTSATIGGSSNYYANVSTLTVII